MSDVPRYRVGYTSDFALIGAGKVWHVLRTHNGVSRGVCGAEGKARSVELAVDSRAARIGKYNVCGNCSALLLYPTVREDDGDSDAALSETTTTEEVKMARTTKQKTDVTPDPKPSARSRKPKASETPQDVTDGIVSVLDGSSADQEPVAEPVEPPAEEIAAVEEAAQEDEQRDAEEAARPKPQRDAAPKIETAPLVATLMEKVAKKIDGAERRDAASGAYSRLMRGSTTLAYVWTSPKRGVLVDLYAPEGTQLPDTVGAAPGRGRARKDGLLVTVASAGEIGRAVDGIAAVAKATAK